MNEQVERDRKYYAEYNKSRLETRPDIDIPWYFDRVEDLEGQLAEAQAATRLALRDVGNFETLAIGLGAEVGELKATLERAREVIAAARKVTPWCLASHGHTPLGWIELQEALAALDAGKEAQ